MTNKEMSRRVDVLTRKLMDEVLSLNPNYPMIGAGKMVALREAAVSLELAVKELAKEETK